MFFLILEMLCQTECLCYSTAMVQYFFADSSLTQILVLGLCAFLIGANKMGVPAIGILPVILLALVFPAKLSPGIQLILLAATDVLAVIYYRRHANWKIILRLLPFALVGIALGSIVIRTVDNEMLLLRMMGVLILALVILNLFRERLKSYLADKGLILALFFGVALGFATQLANAAGPIAAMYFVLMRLQKEEYMGVSAWTFLLLNCIKLPIFISEGRITMEALRMDIAIFPLVLVGGICGVLFLKKVPQKRFEQLVEILVFLSALYLCFK